jgi:diguanylate cyclase (GGDEF)-like protein
MGEWDGPGTPGLPPEDARSSDPVERLLEDSWHERRRPLRRRELVLEGVAGALFLCIAVPMAAAGLASHALDVPLAALLVVLYALASRGVEFPLGAGYVVPSYVVLVPMMLLLPPGSAPLFAAGALTLGCLAKVAAGRERLDRLVTAVPDAWHAIGPAAVLGLAGVTAGTAASPGVYALAFLASCVLDLLVSGIRERALLGVRPQVQLRVTGQVWLIDAAFAPIGLLLADAMRRDPAACLLVLPLGLVLAVASRERYRRIAQAQGRLEMIARERARLQAAVGRLGDALAARLDLRALSDVVLRGSVEALDCDAGRVCLSGPVEPLVIEVGSGADAPTVRSAVEQARLHGAPCQVVGHGAWGLGLPFDFLSEAGPVRGAIAVVRHERPFQDDERALIEGLVSSARQAAAAVATHEQLRRQASTDSLTRLGNRRKLTADIEQRLAGAAAQRSLTLALFDLDGFKHYNDTFGHPAGDAMLERLSRRLESAAAPHGFAYRLGGDEFCVLISAPRELVADAVASMAAALTVDGPDYELSASHGVATLPEEATTLADAMEVADERMYSTKRNRSRRDAAARAPEAAERSA